MFKSFGAAFPSKLRTCFIGYPRAEAISKVEAVRSHSALPNDWLRVHPPAQILEFIESMIRLSRDFQEQCRKSSIPFFDVSDGFDEGIEATVQYLKTGRLPA